MVPTNSFSSGQTISSSALNANFTDFASEVSNSLPRDGQAGMSAQFKAFDGTEGTPGIGWSSDTDSGLRRTAGDTFKAVTGGDDLITFGPSGITVETGKTFAADAMSAASLTLTTKLAVAQGGTGSTTATAAFDALAPTTTRGDLITRDASNNVRKAIGSNLTLLQSDGTDFAWVAPATALFSLTASQSDQETGTSTAVWVPPGRQHFHHSAAKAWGLVTVAAGSPTLTVGYNIASVTDGGTGIFSPQFTTSLSSANYVVVATIFNASGASPGGTLTITCAARLTTGFTIHVFTESGDGDPDLVDNVSFSFVVYGDI